MGTTAPAQPPGSASSDLHSLHYQVTSHTKSSKSPTNSHAPWARLFQLRISILRSALTLHAPHTLLGHDPCSPGSPFSDLHSHSTHLTRSLGTTPAAQDLRSPICTLSDAHDARITTDRNLILSLFELCFQPWARRSHSSICSLRSAVCAVSECRDGTGTEAADACTQVTSLQRIRQAQHFIGGFYSSASAFRIPSVELDRPTGSGDCRSEIFCL